MDCVWFSFSFWLSLSLSLVVYEDHDESLTRSYTYNIYAMIKYCSVVFFLRHWQTPSICSPQCQVRQGALTVTDYMRCSKTRTVTMTHGFNIKTNEHRAPHPAYTEPETKSRNLRRERLGFYLFEILIAATTDQYKHNSNSDNTGSSLCDRSFAREGTYIYA